MPTTPTTPRLPTLNLVTLERMAIEDACANSDNLVEAAKHLGITRHALKRRVVKHNVRTNFPPRHNEPKSQPGTQA